MTSDRWPLTAGRESLQRPEVEEEQNKGEGDEHGLAHQTKGEKEQSEDVPEGSVKT